MQRILTEDSVCFSGEEGEFQITITLQTSTEKRTINTQRRIQVKFDLAILKKKKKNEQCCSAAQGGHLV